MKNNFVPYEQALKLKELGFDEQCLCYYSAQLDLQTVGCYDKSHPIHLSISQSDICEAYILTPLWSQAFDWFRTNHNYHYIIEPLKIDTILDWYFSLHSVIDGVSKHIDDTPYKSYEEARLKCLEKLIELCAKK